MLSVFFTKKTMKYVGFLFLETFERNIKMNSGTAQVELGYWGWRFLRIWTQRQVVHSLLEYNVVLIIQRSFSFKEEACIYVYESL